MQDIPLLYQSCAKFKIVYIAPIMTLMKNLYLTPVAIITEQDICKLTLARKLKTALEESIDELPSTTTSKSKVSVYAISENSSIIHDIKNILYEIKLKSENLIILLCRESLSEYIFRRAATFSLLHGKEVWLTFDFNSKSTLEDKHTPSQLLSIESTMHPAIAVSMHTTKKIAGTMNILIAVKDARDRGIISSKYVINHCIFLISARFWLFNFPENIVYPPISSGVLYLINMFSDFYFL